MELQTLINLPQEKLIQADNPEHLLDIAKRQLENPNKITHKTWLLFLDKTRKQSFLQALKTRENRLRWTEIVFKIIQHTDYNYADILTQRTAEHPDRILFQDMSSVRPVKWTYKQINNYIKQIAAFFYKKHKTPHVALFSANSVDSASVDLACLSYGIFDTPLNIHFSSDILIHIFRRLSVNFVVTDTAQRLKMLLDIQKKTNIKFEIIITDPKADLEKKADYYLGKSARKIALSEAENILKNIKRKSAKQVATTMFTSGSTGMPKGVSFSSYNIVSKRFARAAALPQVGKNEVFICYLPLFHTFGRFLEMTGSVFWGGTYVFAGNPSAATLLSLFPKINPTGFISVPIRWVQMYEKSMQAIDGIEDMKERTKIVRKIIGKNLHWGLSAAGYLDPKIFRFFQRHGVALNSGFGMTEATGGITMTPSWEYSEDSVGQALPGMETRLKDTGELEIKSHYLARYLPEAGPEDSIPYPHKDDYWLSTGDIFKIDEHGHHQIIDRVKDIYKNNKGQTVAPGVVEKKFTGVPGIKRTFLVGDGRPYNVLLIVPDKDDPVFKESGDKFDASEYFHQIVMSANRDLAPYERVINFSVTDRDFSADMGELTPKGSFKRKAIEKNYADLIKQLYRSNHIILKSDDISIKIPRWFYRDLGILESNITAHKKYLLNTENKLKLRICKFDDNSYVIGDLVYNIKGNEIDLGRLVRQPKLWVGNPALIQFSPCKESFELSLKNFGRYTRLPKKRKLYLPAELPQVTNLRSGDLIFLNNLISSVLHTEKSTALRNLLQIEQLFPKYDSNKSDIVRRRLEALAWHPDDEIRINAYRILISEDREPDFTEVMPAFISSGKPFLNTDSIQKIARSAFGKRQLEALRKRMLAYRNGLKWPANSKTRKQFENIFKLLLKFGVENPNFYGAIRAEFACWMLFKEEPVLAKKAKFYFDALTKGFRANISNNTPTRNSKEWEKRIVFDEGIDKKDSDEIIKKLSNSHFLKQTIITTYDGHKFDLMSVAEKSIWVSRIRSYRATKHYRMSIITKQGKHFDIHIVLDKKINTPEGLETLYRSIALAGYPHGKSVIAPYGCSNPKEGIVSSRYLSELTAWEKIRAFAELQTAGYLEESNIWRKIFIRSMSTFFRAWENSCRRITPGFVSPNNVVLPENDFSDNSKIISISGWQESQNILPLITAMYRNFYKKTVAHYYPLKKHLKLTWLFHSCIETFGKEKALIIFENLQNELNDIPKRNQNEQIIYTGLKKYLEKYEDAVYFPLALFNAVDRYTHWQRKNKRARTKAKEQTISEMYELYKLDRFPDLVRYKFYRETYFSDSNDDIKTGFEKLFKKMTEDTTAIPLQLTELSDLQSLMIHETDKRVFGRMVFPEIKEEQQVDLILSQNNNEGHVIVRTTLKDKKGVEYTMREPASPAEVGLLYRLFYHENYPKEISKPDRHFVVTDNNERVVAGLCYKQLEDKVVLIDGMAVTSPLHNRGLGSAMMEDFFTRMKTNGIEMIKAHFLFGNYYLRHNFVVDNKWGALVKKL